MNAGCLKIEWKCADDIPCISCISALVNNCVHHTYKIRFTELMKVKKVNSGIISPGYSAVGSSGKTCTAIGTTPAFLVIFPMFCESVNSILYKCLEEGNDSILQVKPAFIVL